MRYSSIDFWKFIFALAIVGHHAYGAAVYDFSHFRYASICVEFFFMCTGFFCASHYLDNDINVLSMGEPVKYTFRKLMRLFPALICSEIVSFFLYARTIDCSFASAKLELMELFITEILFIPTNEVPILGPRWFINVQLYLLPIVCWLIGYRKTRTQMLEYFSWLIPFLYLAFQDGISSSLLYVSWLIRGFCFLCLGIFVYKITSQIQKKNLNAYYRCAMFCVGNICFLTIFFILFKNYQFQKLIVYLFFMGLILVISSRIFVNNSLCSMMGKLSTYMYIYHCPVTMYLKPLDIGDEKKMICLYLVSFSVSIVHLIIETLCKKYSLKHFKL